MALQDYPFPTDLLSPLQGIPLDPSKPQSNVGDGKLDSDFWITTAQNPSPVVLPPANNPMLSGQEFAKMISGGQAVPSMFAPGVSYSSTYPMGFTAPNTYPIGFPSYDGPMNVNPETQPPPPPEPPPPESPTPPSLDPVVPSLPSDPRGIFEEFMIDNQDYMNVPGFDPIEYDWSNIFDEYTTFDPTQYLQQSDLPTYTPLDTSQFLTAADLPTYNQFDPSTYDWSNVFSQPDLSNYALLSDIPSNDPMDTSSFVTQNQLNQLLASMNNSSGQFNNNNFPLDAADIVPLGSYSLLNR